MNLDAFTWTLIEAQNNNEPLLIRRRNFPNEFPKRQFPFRLNIFWQMSDAAPNGMPYDVESNRMQVFEDRIVEATEPDQQTILSLVLTGKGRREYVFHTRNAKEFLQRLTEMPQEVEPYPIEIHRTDDDAWEYIGRVLADFCIS